MLSELKNPNDSVQDSGVFCFKRIIKQSNINERLAKLVVTVEQQHKEYVLAIYSHPNYQPAERLKVGQRYRFLVSSLNHSRIMLKQYTKSDGTQGSSIEVSYCDLQQESEGSKANLSSVEQVQQRVDACAALLKYKPTAADYCLALVLSGVELPKPGV